MVSRETSAKEDDRWQMVKIDVANDREFFIKFRRFAACFQKFFFSGQNFD